jgi:hypothetical protein
LETPCQLLLVHASDLLSQSTEDPTLLRSRQSEFSQRVPLCVLEQLTQRTHRIIVVSVLEKDFFRYQLEYKTSYQTTHIKITSCSEICPIQTMNQVYNSLLKSLLCTSEGPISYHCRTGRGKQLRFSFP